MLFGPFLLGSTSEDARLSDQFPHIFAATNLPTKHLNRFLLLQLARVGWRIARDRCSLSKLPQAQWPLVLHKSKKNKAWVKNGHPEMVSFPIPYLVFYNCHMNYIIIYLGLRHLFSVVLDPMGFISKLALPVPTSFNLKFKTNWHGLCFETTGASQAA